MVGQIIKIMMASDWQSSTVHTALLSERVVRDKLGNLILSPSVKIVYKIEILSRISIEFLTKFSSFKM